MKDEFFPAGSVPHDDPAVGRAMATIDGLQPAEQRELLRSTYRATLAFQRTKDIDHLVHFANNLLATIRLRGIPAYAEAIRSAPKDQAESGGSLDIDEVLNRLME
ncbi:hypothetical protein [Nonomuraea sp. LPB2021202275-12-8]|uniref:hypothetical protein n=1 Tax=Nonomuraea sp. LPB2021202275-12-8 TaxID=3120159 RepID=UPI00300C70B1